MQRQFAFVCFLAASLFFCAQGRAELCNPGNEFCRYTGGGGGGSSSAPRGGNPSSGGRTRINPSAVPIEKGLGIETIMFKNEYDFSLVKGLGRVGAAISPSNSEETFFGPPGFELPEDYLVRKQKYEKFDSSKITLATAFGLYGNKKSGLKRFDLNLGVLGKYNSVTHAVTPGGGLSGVAGPFTFGYAVYSDETRLDYTRYGLTTKPIVRYLVETASAGMFLNYLVLDYSVLRLITTEVATVTVMTATLLLRKSVITVSSRTELSSRSAYNYATRSLETKKKKFETFLGAQFGVGKYLMLGAFYNYYTLHELSLGATIFF